MKTFLSFLLALLPLAASGAPALPTQPAVLRHAFTTNSPTTVTNIVRNIATNSLIHASKLTPGGTLPPLNAANLTNLPSSGGGAGTFNTSQFDVSGGATNIKSGALVTNLNMRNPSYSVNLLSTNAYSVVRGVVDDAQGNGSIIWQQLIPGDTNAGTFTFVSSTVSNSWNPAVNAASPFRSLNDAQLHYGYNMSGMPGYKASLPTWVRGFEPVWFNPFREPQMEIYDRVTFTNGLFNGTGVGFAYTVGLETGTVEATVDANTVGFRSQVGNPTPWMTIASDTNNVGTVTLKGQLNFINSTSQWLIMDNANVGLIGTVYSNTLFQSGGGYDSTTMFEGAPGNASDLRFRLGSGGAALELRHNGTNASDIRMEYGSDAVGWRRFNDGSFGSTWEKRYELPVNTEIAAAAGSYRTLGTLTNNTTLPEQMGTVQLDIVVSGQGSASQRYVIPLSYEDTIHTSWEECLPIHQAFWNYGATHPTAYAVDVRWASGKHEFRLRSLGVNAASSIQAAVVTTWGNNLIWTTDVSGSGTGATVVDTFRNTVLVQSLGKVGINTNNPYAQLHVVGNQVTSATNRAAYFVGNGSLLTGISGAGITNNQILPGIISIQQLTDAGDPHLLSGTNFEGARVFYIDELGVYHGEIASGVTNITASGGATASTPDGGRTFNIDVAGGGGAVTNFGVTASGGNTATTNGNVVTVVGTVDIAKAGGAGTNNYLRGPTIGGVQTNDSLIVSGTITRTNYSTGIRSVESAAGHLFYPTNSATPTININGVTGEITAGNFIGGGSLTDLKLTNSVAGGSTFYDGDDGAQTGTMNNAGTLTLPKFVATGTPGFSGDGSGLTGLIDSQIPNNITIDLSTVASTVTVVDGTDSTSFVGIFDSATGSLAAKTDGALLYNATSGALAATSFFGAGGALTYTGGGNNGNLATTVDTIQELNDAVDNLLFLSRPFGTSPTVGLYGADGGGPYYTYNDGFFTAIGDAQFQGNGAGLTNLTFPDTLTLTTVNTVTIVFEGTTVDDFETTLAVVDPTADRTVTFQNASGTVAFLTDISGGATNALFSNSWSRATSAESSEWSRDLSGATNLQFDGFSVATKTAITNASVPRVYEFALSDETTAITTGTAKVTWRTPFTMTVTAVRASLSTSSSSGIPTVDINEGGTTILSTKLTIDANEKTSTTAAAAAVISDTSLADDAEITFDIDVAGTGATGLKIKIFYTR